MSNIFAALFFAFLNAGTCLGLVNKSELVALDVIFHSTNGSEWKWDAGPAAGQPWVFGGACNQGIYNSSCDPCDGNWQGVTCDPLAPVGIPPSCSGGASRYFPASDSLLCVNSTIVGLDVSQRNLVGQLPDIFSNLPGLLFVNGSQNLLSGILPTSLFALSGLVNVSFYSNCLYGTIPYLGRATSLEILTLTSNRFQGSIPSELGYLPRLQVLMLGNNTISDSIPVSFYASESLQFVDLSANKLKGSIPSAIASMKRLQSLLIPFNCLTNTLPTELGLMTGLSFLSFRFNCISGTLPSEIGSMSSLAVLLLRENRIHGSIPSALARLSKLDTLGMGYNSFNGTLPPSLSNLTSLVRFGVEWTSISGSIPVEFQNLKNLKYIELDDTLLHGPLPEFLGSLTNLELLDFENNFFSGTIPSVWGSLTSMTNFDISGNSLRGTLPSELLNWKALQVFEINSNEFTGPIYSTMSLSFSNLARVNMGLNSFTGSLPSDLWNLTKLEVLYLARNYLHGSIPPDIGRLIQLTFLNLGVNSFTGTIPDEIGFLTNLNGLLLDNNKLTGEVPTTIAALSGIEVLALSKNSLSGTLPTLSAMTKLINVTVQRNLLKGSLDNVFSEQQQEIEIIDVADNAFSGTLPSSLFNHSKIQLISASKNCFHGYIPEDICLVAPTLEKLILDGLTSGETCRKSLGFYFEFYVLQRVILGAIPACLFQLPNLKRFHASGNGIRSKLPDIPKDSKLSQIQLAWNNIHGEIPKSFLNAEFVYLDLGVNKISGGSDHIRIDATHADSYLDLRNNRLSGKIPAKFLELPNINILEGNMFECSIDREELPEADPSYARYTCGSNDANQALILWAVSITVLLALAIFYWYYGKREEGDTSFAGCSNVVNVTWIADFIGLTNKFLVIHPELPILFPRVAYFHRIYCHMRYLVAVVTLLIALVYLPLYIVIHSTAVSSKTSLWADIFSEEYVWSSSGLWLSGIGFAGVILVLWAVAVILVAALMYPEVRLQLKSRFEAICELNDRVYSVPDASVTRPQFSRQIRNISSALKTSRTGSHLLSSSSERADSVPCYVFQRRSLHVFGKQSAHFDSRSWNLAVSESALVFLNIVVVFGANIGYIIGIQSSLSAPMKFFLQILLPAFSVLWGRVMDKCILYLFQASEHSPYRIYFGILVFNLIVAPLLTGVFVDSNCLLYFLKAPEPLYTNTVVHVCSERSNTNLFTVCYDYVILTFSTSFIPLYSYHDTCSHSIISRFIPPMLLYYLISCFVVPYVKYKMFFGSSGDAFERAYNSLPSWCRALLPKYLMRPEVNEESYNNFPSARMLATTHVNLTVLLTFGLVFPPLAVIIALLVLVQTWLHLEMITASLNAWCEHRASDNKSESDAVTSSSHVPNFSSSSFRQDISSIDGIAMISNPVRSMETCTDGSQLDHPERHSGSRSCAVPPSCTPSMHRGSSLRWSVSKNFDVDPTVLDIYLSADCTGYLSCSLWMLLVSALFCTMLLSDMVSDKIGFLAARTYWFVCAVVLVAILLVYIWLLHEYLSRPMLKSERDKKSTSWCPAPLSQLWSSCREALGFVWDLCFGDGELPIPEPPNPHPKVTHTDRSFFTILSSLQSQRTTSQPHVVEMT